MNLSIKNGDFAEKWKVQLFLPLHKKNDKLNGNNYRPVTHIIEVGKIVYNHFYHGIFSTIIITASLQTVELLQPNPTVWPLAISSRKYWIISSLTPGSFSSVWPSRAQNTSSETPVLWLLRKQYQMVLLLPLQSHTIVQVETKSSHVETLGDYGVPQGVSLAPLYL